MSKSEDGFRIGSLLLIPADTLKAYVHQGYHDAGFTDLRPAHHVIFGILRPEGDRVIDLAKRVQTTKQAMGYLVAYLEECGYLERVADTTDRRAQIVRRTAKGWEVNRTATRLVGEIQEQWAEQLGKERMEQLMLLLGDLVKIIGVQYKGSVAEQTLNQTQSANRDGDHTQRSA